MLSGHPQLLSPTLFYFYHRKLELKCHDTGNGWTFVSVSAWKSSVNADFGVGILLSPHDSSLLNDIERIQLRMKCDPFNSNSCPTVISYNSPNNANEETDIIAVYNELSSLVLLFPKHNVLIIGGDMNPQIDKDENNKYC